MITKTIIDNYIDKIPPSPKVLKDTLLLLAKEELSKAAKMAQLDLALSSYLKKVVNKPIYGFRNEVTDLSQIFTILGIAKSNQIIFNYMITLLSPDKWVLFKLNNSLFSNLQAELSTDWNKILLHLNIDNKNIQSSIALLPASIIVAEALFNNKVDDIHLLKSVNPIDLNTLLQRLTNLDLFDICVLISNKWEMPEDISNIIQAASGIKPSKDNNINELGKWMHLLLFFTLSKKNYIDAQLNDFIDFQIEYVDDIYQEFITVMDIS